MYLNKNNYYEIKPQDLDGGSQGQSYFSPDADYYTLNDSWKELTIGSIQDGQPCYSNSTCSSNNCRNNPATGENKCVPLTATISSTDGTEITTGTLTYTITSPTTVTIENLADTSLFEGISTVNVSTTANLNNPEGDPITGTISGTGSSMKVILSLLQQEYSCR